MNHLEAWNRENRRKELKSTGPSEHGCLQVFQGSGQFAFLIYFYYLPEGTSPLTLQRQTNELFTGCYEDAAQSQHLTAVLTKEKKFRAQRWREYFSFKIISGVNKMFFFVFLDTAKAVATKTSFSLFDKSKCQDTLIKQGKVVDISYLRAWWGCLHAEGTKSTCHNGP